MAGGTPMPEEPYVTHLGDGLYVVYTGCSVVFTTYDEPIVEMDLSSLRNLVAFLQRCEHHLEKSRVKSAS